MSTKARAVVFDLFHTLVDPEEHRPSDFHRAEAVAELLGVPVDPFVEWWDGLEEERTRGTTPPNPQGFPPPGKVTYVGDGGSDELTGARRAFFGRVIAARWFVPANGLRSEDEQRRLERDADVAIHDVREIPDRV